MQTVSAISLLPDSEDKPVNNGLLQKYREKIVHGGDCFF